MTASHILKGTVVTGDIHTKYDIRIEGCVRGNVRCSSELYLTEGAEVNGNAQCATLHTDGVITGHVEVEGDAFLDENAVISGHLTASRLTAFPTSLIKKGFRLREDDKTIK